MKRVLLAFAALVLLVVLGIPALLGWLIGTESGNGVLLTRVAPLIGATLEIGHRQGSVAGKLEWDDLVYEDKNVRVELRHLVLQWRPQRLWNREVKVDELLAEGLQVRLKPKPDDNKPPSGKPPLTRLPVGIDISRLSVREFELWTVGALKPIAIPSADLVGRWAGDRIHLTRLDLEYPEVGPLKLQGDLQLREDGVQVQRLSVLAPAVLAARGFVGYEKANDLELGWKALIWPLPGVAGAAADAPPIVTSRQGSVTLKGPWSDLQFALAAALGERGQIKAQGRWNGQLDTHAQWTDLAWPLVPADPKVPAPWQSARGRLAFKGLPAAYGFDVDADVLARDKAGHVQAQGSGSTSAVDLKLLRLMVGEASIEAAGPLAWAPQPSGALRGKIRRLDPSLFVAGWPGDINGEFSVEGTQAKTKSKATPDSPSIPALVFKLDLKDSKLRDYPLQLQTQGRFANKVLQLESLELRSGDSVLTASGRASEPYDVQAELLSPKMAELAPALAGSLRAKLHFRGSPSKPQLQAEAELAKASWKDYAVTGLQLKADLDWNGPLTADLSATELTAGTRIDSLALTTRGTRGDHQITLKAGLPELQAELALAGAYDDRSQRWQGQLTGAELTPAKLAPWKLENPAALNLSAQQNDLALACWLSTPGRVCLEAHQTPQTAQAAVQIADLAFASFKVLLPSDLELQGTLSGQASAELVGGVLRKAQADLHTSAGFAQIGEQRVGFKPASLSISDAPEQGSAQLRLPLDVGGVEADARFAPGTSLTQRSLSGEVRLDFPDLAFLSVLSSEVSSASGRLSGRYALAGKVGAPELQGEAQLSDGRIKLTRPGIELTELNATVSGQPGGRVKVQASARSGEGQIKVEGEVENRPKSAVAKTASEPLAAAPTPASKPEPEPKTPIAPPSPETPEPVVASSSTTPPPKPAEPLAVGNQGGLHVVMSIIGEDFLVADLPKTRVWVSPDLRFDLADKNATLKGTLTVPRAEIKLQQGENNGVGASSDQVIVNAAGEKPAPVESLKIATEVKLVLGKKVSLEGFGLKTRLEGDVTAVDNPGRDTLGYGELRLEDGQYKAYGQDLVIETGKLLFNGGPIAKPGLEIRAVRNGTLDVEVGMNVRGTLDKPVLTLFSEPVMTQQQQLSWLLLGQPLDQSNSSQNRNALGGAAVALGLGGGSALAQNFQKGLGVDEISLGSDPGETSEQARITVGKYLSPKIFVSYGVGLFQPGQVFKLLYDLGRGFKLSTESGTYTGGDLLYSVERR